jgi:hypothetical protein
MTVSENTPHPTTSTKPIANWGLSDGKNVFRVKAYSISVP